MQKTILILVATLLLTIGRTRAQQPAPPAPEVPPPAAEAPATTPPAESDKTAGTGKSFPRFLILGTVFDEKLLAFSGVQVRVRRSTEKKFRWETFTNSRGEFAVRVPEGPIYEVVVRAKKYREQSQSVNSKNGDTQLRLSIQLKTVSEQTTGAKP